MTTHIDEGTIHAWIDGALDAERSRSVEAHVRECAQCAEAVAEARGLLAASSRILGALDDVPAGVIPASAPRKQKRMWRAAPWVTGIAAVLMAAVVLRTSDDVMKSEPAIMSAPVARIADSAPAIDTAPVVVRAAAPAPPSAIGSVAANAPVTARRDVGAAAGAASVPSQPAAEAALAQRDLAAEAFRTRRERAQVAADVSDAERAQAQKVAGIAAAIAPPAPVDAEPQVPSPPPNGSAGMTGCYHVIAAMPSVGAAAGFAEERRQRARAAAPVASAAEPQRASNRLLIRLDSLAGRSGFIVRDAVSDSSLGWWTRQAEDSARLELRGTPVFFLTRADRSACPDRP